MTLDVAEFFERRASFAHEVRAFLDLALPADWQGIAALEPVERDAFARAWREQLVDRGWLAASWPTEYGGGGLTDLEQAVLGEECVKVGVPIHPHPNDLFGLNLLGPTLMVHGTPEQQAYFLPRMISGEIQWAQGFSEPSAGSDLFALRTRAVLEDGQWRINGQKVWQTAGQTANWLFALVRTDPQASTRNALSFLLIPIDQEGVEVRGIANLAGDVEFAEVFFGDAFTDEDMVLGEVGQGVAVAITLLGFERGAEGLIAAAAEDVRVHRLLASRALPSRETPTQEMGEMLERAEVLRCVSLAGLAAENDPVVATGNASVQKILTSESRQVSSRAALALVDTLPETEYATAGILGPQPVGADPDNLSVWWKDYANARAETIYGGSLEIQLNTIAERVLGMPREAKVKS